LEQSWGNYLNRRDAEKMQRARRFILRALFFCHIDRSGETKFSEAKS
jgi:hypothetical protein